MKTQTVYYEMLCCIADSWDDGPSQPLETDGMTCVHCV